MTEKPETTESFPPQKNWLDRLEPIEAVRIMAEDQAKVFDVIDKILPNITEAALNAAARLSASETGRLIYAGAGTSGRIGVQDGVELTPTFGWPMERREFLIAGGADALVRSVEDAEDNIENACDQVEQLSINADDIFIGITASGKTPYTLAALIESKNRGALTIALANNPNTPILEQADHGLLLHTGAESVAGSTRMKAGTAQKICLNIISTLMMVQMGRVKKGTMSHMQATNAKLRERQQVIDKHLKGQ